MAVVTTVVAVTKAVRTKEAERAVRTREAERAAKKVDTADMDTLAGN